MGFCERLPNGSSRPTIRAVSAISSTVVTAQMSGGPKVLEAPPVIQEQHTAAWRAEIDTWGRPNLDTFTRVQQSG